MRLELNTNGAWRVVLRHLQGDAMRNAMIYVNPSANTLAGQLD